MLVKLLKRNKVNFFLIFFSYLLIFLSIWIKKTFGSHVYYVEIIYNAFVNYEGIKNSPQIYKLEFFLYVINLSIFFSLLTVLIFNKIKNKFNLINEKSYLMFLSFFLFLSFIFFLFQFKFHDYLIAYSKYDQNKNLFKNPNEIKFQDPLNKKNLIIVYVESLEYLVSDLSKISDFNKLSKKNYNSSPILDLEKIEGKKIINFKEAPTASFSLGGIISSQCSIPFYPSISINLNNFDGKKILCLSDVLNDYGYKQYHFMTVDKKFHRTDLFTQNHFYNVRDNNKIRERYPDAEIAWGNGVFDDILLEDAKNKILELHNTNTPFNVVIKTTDTHYPYEFTPRCNLAKSKIEEINAYNSYKCISNLIKKFFINLNEENILDNTVIVIMGDHLAYDMLIKLHRYHESRNIYFKINSSKTFTRSKMNHFDIAPTILQEMGFLSLNDTRFGFGVSLYNDNTKYNYDEHYKSVMNKNLLSDFYLRNILKNF